MALANSEVGGTVCGMNRWLVERWSVLGNHGLGASGALLASLGVCLRCAVAGFHTG
jgi:hypothetical protein